MELKFKLNDYLKRIEHTNYQFISQSPHYLEIEISRPSYVHNGKVKEVAPELLVLDGSETEEIHFISAVTNCPVKLINFPNL